jgi:hypothetical protein
VSASTSAAQPPDLRTTAFWNKPADVSWGDYLLAHLAKPFQGLGQSPDASSDDFMRAAVDSATFGQGDRLQSYLTGNTLDQERANTQGAYQRLGPVLGTAASALGYAPYGEIGGAAKIGKLAAPYLGGWGSRALGASLEGGIAGGAGAWGHGDDPYWGAATGVGLAGASGALSKVASPLVTGAANKIGRISGALTSPEDVTTALRTAKENAYAALRDVPVPDAADAVANARDAIEAHDPNGTLRPYAGSSMATLGRLENSLEPGAGQELTGQGAMDYLTGQRANMDPDDYQAAMNGLFTTGKVSLSGESPQLNASDILTSLDALRDAKGPGAGAENEIAPIIEKHLNDALDNAGAGDLLKQAKAAHMAYKNADFLQQAGQNLQLLRQSPASDAARIATTYYPSGAADIMAGGDRAATPAAKSFQSLADIANAGGGYQTAYGLMHAVHPVVEDAVIGMAGSHLGPALGAAAMYGGVKPALSAALSRGQRAATQGAINAAYPALTGSSVAYSLNAAQALRTLLFGQAAGSLPARTGF